MIEGNEVKIFCNACGREFAMRRKMGREFKVCSTECVREMEWRNALTIMGKPYRPSPEMLAWAKDVLGETKENE